MYIYFALTIAFLFATLATTFIDFDIKNDLVSHLKPHEVRMYNESKRIRLMIYYQGLFFGVLLALLYLFMDRKKNMYVATTIVFVVNYFYYILYPKPFYMIEILDNKMENMAWLKIYKYMQYRYHIGFLLGLVFSHFLFRAIYCR
tara:strand:+ start:598 stop:1032 length:435 start_codon:yes stop_codon:yes gene_type:complete